jgi:putative flippase GtrA
MYNREALRFLFVGSLSAITNLVLFYLTADLMGWNVNFCSALAFLVGVTQNYFLNGIWSFKAVKPLTIQDYFGYIGVNLVGLAANLVILNLLIHFLNPDPKVIAQAVGIMAGTIFNYILASALIFKPHKV